MSIKSELQNLREPDIWSIMLFVLFKMKDIPEYSGISELAYTLDKKNFLKLCEYFGGQVIKIPTVEELETLLYSLLLYQYVDVEKMSFDDAVVLIENKDVPLLEIKSAYRKLKEILKSYEISPRTY